jgi:hypothetical protein
MNKIIRNLSIIRKCLVEAIVGFKGVVYDASKLFEIKICNLLLFGSELYAPEKVCSCSFHDDCYINELKLVHSLLLRSGYA